MSDSSKKFEESVTDELGKEFGSVNITSSGEVTYTAGTTKVKFSEIKPKIVKVDLNDNVNFDWYSRKVEQKGEKHNNYKLPMSKLFKQFPRALQAVVLTSCYGHDKYKNSDQDWMNFSRVKGGNESYFDADIRHQLDREIYGEDDESGLPHVFHEAFDKLAKCELWIKENNIDIKKYSEEYLKKLNGK